MKKSKVVVATMKSARKPGWRYWPCVDEHGVVVIMRRDGEWAQPQTVENTKFRHVQGSSYELEGDHVVRYYDPAYEKKRQAALAAREVRLARLRAPKLAASVAAFAKRIGAKVEVLDTDEYDDVVPAIYLLRLRKAVELEWLLEPGNAPDGAFAFAFSTELAADDESRDRTREIGVVPREDAPDIVRLVPTQDAAEPGVLVKTIAALVRAGNGQVVTASPIDHVIQVHLRKKPKAIDVHARALHKLGCDESSVREMRSELEKGRVFLWWD